MLTEREQGRSPALNAGIRLAQGDIIVTTDDDVRVEPDWLIARRQASTRTAATSSAGACCHLARRATRVAAESGGQQWAVIALLDYGSRTDAVWLPRAARREHGVPAQRLYSRGTARSDRRDARLERSLGKRFGSGAFARAPPTSGACTSPTWPFARHPGVRLNKKYFRRWFYWRGISRALLYAQYGLDMEKPEDPALDPRIVPQLLGVPRYLFRKALAHLIAGARTMLRGDAVAAFEHELWLCFFAGIVRQRWTDRHARPASCGPATSLSPLDHGTAFCSAPDDVDRAPDRSRDRAYAPCSRRSL